MTIKNLALIALLLTPHFSRPFEGVLDSVVQCALIGMLCVMSVAAWKVSQSMCAAFDSHKEAAIGYGKLVREKFQEDEQNAQRLVRTTEAILQELKTSKR